MSVSLPPAIGQRFIAELRRTQLCGKCTGLNRPVAVASGDAVKGGVVDESGGGGQAGVEGVDAVADGVEDHLGGHVGGWVEAVDGHFRRVESLGESEAVSDESELASDDLFLTLGAAIGALPPYDESTDEQAQDYPLARTSLDTVIAALRRLSHQDLAMRRFVSDSATDPAGS